MKALIQRVSRASVSIENAIFSEIGPGLLIFLGIGKNDDENAVYTLAEKVAKLRIFEDSGGKMNLSIKESEGSILVVSQFTLYADCRKGTRPSFFDAADPERAEDYYEKFIHALREQDLEIKTGKFGAYMDIALVNDGPVSIILEV